MITVSVHAAVEYPHIAKCYAALLQEWKNGGPLSGWLGNEGEWEENARLRGSFVSKIHIRLPDEPSWPPSMPSAARKSDSYLVYTRHFLHPDRYQISKYHVAESPRVGQNIIYGGPGKAG